MLMLSMYWGWCKYHYQEHPKAKIPEAKAWAIEVLNSCPPNVIWRFINQSWRFVDAYKKGLTGEAAAWVVCKQKSHTSVSQLAMQALKAQAKVK